MVDMMSLFVPPGLSLHPFAVAAYTCHASLLVDLCLSGFYYYFIMVIFTSFFYYNYLFIYISN